MDITSPLSGVRIVDFTFQGAGPHTTMLLASLGAEVIKVESSRRPDPTRGRENRPYLRSLLFDDVNAGKRSVSLDMKNKDAVRTARKLIGRSAAVVDNFRPGVLDSWGLTRESLVENNARLVTASLSALGANGPLSRLPGYAGIFNALSGLGDLTGYASGPPTELRTSVDMRAGAFFAVGIVHGLIQARHTGHGMHIDFSAAESISALCGEHVAAYGLLGRIAERIGNADEAHTPQGVFRTADDRWLAVSIRDDDDWRAFGKIADEGSVGFRQDTEAQDVVGLWVGARSRDEALSALRAQGVPAGPVQDAADLWEDQQLRARGFFHETDTTTGAGVIAAAPWLVGGRRAPVVSGPELGADTDLVLQEWLDMSTTEIDELRRSGALT